MYGGRKMKGSNRRAFATRPSSKSMLRVLSVILGVALLISIAQIAFASWVPLNSPQACAPSYGSFDWQQWYGGLKLGWYQREQWLGSRFDCIRSMGNVYHLETEAYNPGLGYSCDKLHASYTNYTLPLTNAPAVANGCGSNVWKEEVKFRYIDSTRLSQGTQYWTYVSFDKVNLAAETHEVNWSFSQGLSDYWLAKVGYTIDPGPSKAYSPICSSPSDILSGFAGCP
jgi:hypothetical protein